MEVIDDDDSRISYQGDWSVDHITGANGGTVHSSTGADSSLTLKFTGSSIRLDALENPNGANFTITLDGSQYGPYSLYAPNASVGNVWSQNNLNSNEHTLVIKRISPNNDDNSSRQINVDAFRISAASSTSSASGQRATSSSSTSSSSRSSTTSSPSSETTSRSSSSSSTSTNSTSIVGTTLTIPPALAPLTTPTLASSTSQVNSTSASTADTVSSAKDTRTGIILSAVVGFIIFVCLSIIAVVGYKRHRAKAREKDLRASTTPAYQTRSATRGLFNLSGGLSPLSRYSATNYGHNIQPASSMGHSYGHSYEDHTKSDLYSQQPVTNAASSNLPGFGSAAKLGTSSSAGHEQPSRYYLYPDDPSIAYGGYDSGRVESMPSDYPYPVAYQSPRSTSPSPSPNRY
ncbi:hypothetical protein CPB86DRAFT_810276 [Serendipita vermifera]|nr:hypothetical protein CPB86DRAFT_810276 [Serendipita vermifera]